MNRAPPTKHTLLIGKRIALISYLSTRRRKIEGTLLLFWTLMHGNSHMTDVRPYLTYMHTP